MDPIVDVDFVRANPDLVLADVRWTLNTGPDRGGYEAGHVPGAVFVDLDVDLASPAGDRGRHPLPAPEDFAARMSALGIGDGARVVAYDGVGGGVAARLVWMLRALGEEAALLDGGLDAWAGELEAGASAPATATFTARPWPPGKIVGADDLERFTLLDARAPERFRGEVEPVDPVAGHIPGAINLFWRSQLDGGRFRGDDQLRALYADLNLTSPVVVSCGSGVTACHLAVVLEKLGAADVRLYPGSWSEWCALGRATR
jgi:thiosulfate/3-mercaptopyruvate sulfurtransferase